jgi:hypothetical protein
MGLLRGKIGTEVADVPLVVSEDGLYDFLMIS